MKRLVMAIIFLAVLGGGAIAYRFLWGASPAAPAGQASRQAPAVPVVVATAERQPIPVRLDAIGTVQSIANVSIKSRVDAQIDQVRVQDGQYVKTGDVLFHLDSRAAEAQVHQMEAQLARDRAQLVNAKRDVDRFAPLVAKDFVSRQQYDTAVTTAQALEASVKADEAALDNAKVLLTYYTITAPIDGRVGMVQSKLGNNLKANDVSFATINQVKPIYVNFSVSERELPGIRAAMAKGSVAVSALAPGDAGSPIMGKLAFFDNAVDATTGTIALRGIFANDDERLWPGQYVNVSVTLAVQEDALVVPQAAVQIGQDKPFVFIVRPDNTAEARKVEIVRTTDGKSIIASGVSAGDRVVVDGQLRLTNGARVDIRSAQSQPPVVGNAS
jgi:membrane fusion protein, multidrug efflux system